MRLLLCCFTFSAKINYLNINSLLLGKLLNVSDVSFDFVQSCLAPLCHNALLLSELASLQIKVVPHGRGQCEVTIRL